MAMEKRELERLIQIALPGADIEIQDMAGDGEHYAAQITAEQFVGLGRVQQHKLVYKALEGHDLHALALQTRAP